MTTLRVYIEPGLYKLTDSETGLPKGYLVNIQPSRETPRVRRTFIHVNKARQFIIKHRAEFQDRTFLGKPEVNNTLVRELIDGYYQRHVLVHIKNPERSEVSRLNLFRDFFQQKPVHAISHTDGEVFMSRRLESGVKPGTVNRDLNVLRSIFKWAVKNRYLEASPFKDLQKIKTDEVRIRWLDVNEVQNLLRACYDLNDSGLAEIIKVALNTGFRRDNIIRLEKADIGDMFITARKTKSGKPYQVPISTALHSILARLPDAPRLLDTSNLKKRYEAACKKAELWKGKNDPNKVTFHTLRHTFAAHTLLAGVDIYTVSHWLGHASVAITQKHYGHLAESHHTEQIKKFSGIS